MIFYLIQVFHSEHPELWSVYAVWVGGGGGLGMVGYVFSSVPTCAGLLKR